ncbi:MAG: bifunctional folylpolyglutamate synthase/dihydrofolate synthase [Magnetococcales bacterium]|nr:bifunctional folylpolyglutamate synthase/dihydrofolate synthase [Magnetococcales bacterium]
MSEEVGSTRLAALLERTRHPVRGRVRLGLERVSDLMAWLGNPQDRLRHVHVAGTNGKGSVIAFLEAILLQAGWHVGRYTSPHLQRFGERLVIDRQEIDAAGLEACLKAVLQAPASGEATFFELTTAAAWLHFAGDGRLAGNNPEGKPAVVLLETGLGGRLDATNLIRPEMTVLTRIDLDHRDYLGETLEAIAFEKAGILKKGVAAVSARQCRTVSRVLRERAGQVGVDIHFSGEAFQWQKQGDGTWSFQEGDDLLPMPAPALAGEHQYDNAAVAVATARRLGVVVGEVLARGVAGAVWPGRLEWFPGRPALLLDGAHNPAGAETLANYLKTLGSRPRILLFGALRDKDWPEMVSHLATCVDAVFCVPVDASEGVAPDHFSARWPLREPEMRLFADPAQGIAEAVRRLPPEGLLVVAGSLRLVGTVRSRVEEGLLPWLAEFPGTGRFKGIP